MYRARAVAPPMAQYQGVLSCWSEERTSASRYIVREQRKVEGGDRDGSTLRAHDRRNQNCSLCCGVGGHFRRAHPEDNHGTPTCWQAITWPYHVTYECVRMWYWSDKIHPAVTTAPTDYCPLNSNFSSLSCNGNNYNLTGLEPMFFRGPRSFSHLRGI